MKPIKKTLISVKKKEKDHIKYFVKDDLDFHAKEGVIKKEEIDSEFGSIIKSHMNKEFYLLPSSFPDKFSNIRRNAQIIIPKVAGQVIINTGMNKNSVVVEAGTGSGGLACLLANTAKEVYSYDISEEAVKLGKENAEFLGIKNAFFDVCNLKEKSPKKDVDVVVLDMIEAEKAVDSAFEMLKVGGYVVGYFPQITQARDFVFELERKGFVVEKVEETIEREWVVADRILRPKFLIQGHTAFLVFARKARK